MPLKMPLNLAKLRTIRQFADENPAFTHDYLHYLIAHREQNGIEACLVRVNAKIFIDTEAFAEWLQNQPREHERGGGHHAKKRPTRPAQMAGVAK